MHHVALDLIELKLIQLGMSRKRLVLALDLPDKIWHYGKFDVPPPVWSYEDIYFMFNDDKLVLVYQQKNDKILPILAPDSS